MTPKRIILVRHGRSAANDDTTIYSRVPDYKIELVEKGREQARVSGEHIRELIGDESYGVYVSPYRRTLQTKDCIVERIGHAPVFDYQAVAVVSLDSGFLRFPSSPAELSHRRDDSRRRRGVCIVGTFFGKRIFDGRRCIVCC